MPAAVKPSRFFVSDTDPASKQAILQAALGLFVRHGLASTTIRMIADAAGYTNPAMFKFFESKDALALDLFGRCYKQLYTSIHAAASAEKFDEALAGVIGAFLRAMEEDLEAALFVQDSLRELWPRMPVAARKHSLLGTLKQLVQRGVREGRVRGYHSVDIPVAALIGLMAQTGRMLYFEELATPASRHQPELTLALERMFAG
jgi:AcrR family transcriptional regulator